MNKIKHWHVGVVLIVGAIAYLIAHYVNTSADFQTEESDDTQAPTDFGDALGLTPDIANYPTAAVVAQLPASVAPAVESVLPNTPAQAPSYPVNQQTALLQNTGVPHALTYNAPVPSDVTGEGHQAAAGNDATAIASADTGGPNLVVKPNLSAAMIASDHANLLSIKDKYKNVSALSHARLAREQV